MSVSAVDRKLEYVRTLASESGIDLSMMDLASILELLYLSIDFNCLFRMFLDMYLCLDLNLDWSLFDYWNFDWTMQWNFLLPSTTKGKYGISTYGDFMFDPPLPTSKELERSMWTLRKHSTETDVPFYKGSSISLSTYIDIIKQRLAGHGVSDDFLDGMENLLAVVEGKVLNCAYVDFAFVDLSAVMGDEPEGSPFDIREFENWKTIGTGYSFTMWETLVDYAFVDYCRAGDDELLPSEQLSDTFGKIVDEFKARAGEVTVPYQVYYGQPYGPAPYGQPAGAYGGAPVTGEAKMLYPRVFMTQRVDQYHYEGGHHQILIQSLINKVKEILDREGVFANFRMIYTAYAQEQYYLSHQPHRHYKRWKVILTKDDIRQKYLQMGADASILDKVDLLV